MKLVADHIPSSTTATFGVDSQKGATQSVTIPIVRDRTTENAETFAVLLSAGARLRPQALCLERSSESGTGYRLVPTSANQFCTTVTLGTEPSGSAVRRAAMKRSPLPSTT